MPNLIELRRTVAFRQRRLNVNTPKSGQLRTIDAPASLVAQPRGRHSVRQAEAGVSGAALGPWAFPSATDPDQPTNSKCST